MQQVEFQAVPSATVAGQWIGVVLDERGHVLTRTGLTYDTSDEARLGGADQVVEPLSAAAERAGGGVTWPTSPSTTTT